MKYKNAREVLPESLIREIQKYVRGQHLYIPQTERLGWGEKNGARGEMERRNRRIYQKYRAGSPVSELAAHYYLSEERIRGVLHEYQYEEGKPACLLDKA